VQKADGDGRWPPDDAIAAVQVCLPRPGGPARRRAAALERAGEQAVRPTAGAAGHRAVTTEIEKGGEVMEAYKAPMSVRTLGLGSLALGILGAAFFWWTPMGMVISLFGLLVGFIGWTFARRATAGISLAIGGMLASLSGLILCSVVAALGMEVIKSGALR